MVETSHRLVIARAAYSSREFTARSRTTQSFRGGPAWIPATVAAVGAISRTSLSASMVRSCSEETGTSPIRSRTDRIDLPDEQVA